MAQSPDDDAPPILKKKAYLRIFVAFLVIGVVSTLVFLSVKFSAINQAADWINHNELGWVGWVCYIALCVVASLCLVPQTPIEAAAGIIWGDAEYGFWKALIAAYIGKQVGSWCCFGVGRLSSRRIERRVTRTLSGAPHLTAVETKNNKAALLLEATTRVFSQKPHTLTFLASAAAIPAWIKNFGLATIPDVDFFRHFVPWTALCGIFYSVANVLIGVSVSNGTHHDDGDTPQKSHTEKVVMAVMAIVTFIGIVTLSFFTKVELENQLKLLDEEEEEGMRSSSLSQELENKVSSEGLSRV